MKSKLNALRAATTAALLTSTLFAPMTVSAAPGTLADSPLFLSNSVEPNVLFVLDDSGSMSWGLMAPEPEGKMYSVHGANECQYRDAVPGPDAGSTDVPPTEARLKELLVPAPYGGLWRAWSKDYNKVYYDPGVTYTPWPGENSGGTPYARANPTAALHDPYKPADGSINLTTVKSYTTDFCPYMDGADFTVSNYHPARYNQWIDTDLDGVVDPEDGHLTVEIKPLPLPVPGGFPGGENRRDCAEPTICTYAEEIQNFANWYSYYRNREYVAKSAYGQVIARAANTRMGVVTLHDNGNVDTPIASMNADPRSGAKGTLLNHLYNGYGSGVTPLRSTFNAAGKYLSCDSGDYGTCPALDVDDGGECQQNFALVMTDGFYNGDADYGTATPVLGNVDGDNDSTWDSGNAGPYGDTITDTLADIAMEYYETDIRPAANNVNPPPGGIDENTAQHVVTYSIAFGVDGTLRGMPANRTDPFAWPTPDTDPKKIDDLRHAAWNGRGEFLNAQDPGQLIDGLRSALQSIQGRVGSAASVAFNTGSLSTNSQVYLSLFNSERWDGNLLAYDLDPFTGAIDTTPDWGVAGLLNARDLAANPRTLLTYNGTDGIAFQWASLTATQKNDFRTNPDGSLDDEATGMARHDYLRGARGCETSSSDACSYNDGTDTFTEKTLRERAGLLGDIIHSGPVFVGAPESNWPDVAPFPGTVGNTYTEYRTAQASRPGTIYVGANDGMLHGFKQANGAEILGYIPNALYSAGALDGLHYLSDPAYTHRYAVDLTPSVADAYIRTATGGSVSWKTVVVGGLRGGGRGLYALDVTNPTSFSESGGTPANVVLWEFTDADLGYTFSKPSIVPLAGPSGTIRWAAIFGNGYNDGGSGVAQLFIVFLEGGLDGVWTLGTDYVKISTGVGDTTNRNGLSTPAVVDTDGDGLADRAYAGDLEGNMWAFDLSGSTISNWEVAYSARGDAAPLFTAPAGQQITTTPVIVRNSSFPASPSNEPNLIVLFGTGQYLTAADTNSTQTQTMYGILDSGTRDLDRGDLVEQVIGTGSTSEGVLGRTLTDNAVDYSRDDGWYIDLPDTGERVVTDPVVRGELVFFNTMMPDTNPCNQGGSGWQMVASWLTGGRPTAVSFDLNRDGLLTDLDEIDGAAAAGDKVTGIATSPVNLSNKRYTSTTETLGGGSIEVTDIIETGGAKTGRLSWEELTP